MAATAAGRLRRGRRPLAVLAAAFLGLTLLGGTAGATLGAVGAAGDDSPRAGHHQRHDDRPGQGFRPPR